MTFAALAALLLLAPALARAQAGWTGVVTDLSPTGEFASDLEVAIDAAGNATAVWVTGGMQNRVRVSHLPAGSREWSAPVGLAGPTPVGTQAENPDIAVDANGRAVVVWTVRAQGASGGTAQYAEFVASFGNWTSPADVPGATDALYPEVVIDQLANLTVVWHRAPPLTLTYTLESARFIRTSSSWTSVQTLATTGSGAFGGGNKLVVDSDGNVTALWTWLTTAAPEQYSIRTRRFDALLQTWGAETPLATSVGRGRQGQLAINSAGNIAAIWRLDNGTSSVIQTAIYTRATSSWSSAATIPGTTDAESEHVAIDDSNNLIAIWSSSVNGDDVVRAARLPAGGLWSAAVTLSDPAGDADPGDVEVDAAGNAIAVWNHFDGTNEIAQAARYNVATAQWTNSPDLGSMGDDGEDVAVAMNARGHAVISWEYEDENVTEIAQVTEWLATPAAPTITTATPGNGSVSVTFTPPSTSEPAFAPTDYQYSVDNGATWQNRATASTASPIEIGSLVNGVTYSIRIRAVNAAGPGAPSAPVTATPGSGVPPNAPTNLRATAIVGNTLTLEWTMPSGGTPPTGFVVEGGLGPGEVLGSIATGSTATTFTFVAPSGVFFIRVHAVANGARSPASNEIRVAINPPMLPSAPENLVGQALGSTLNLSWRNTSSGGAPTQIVLDVSGAIGLSVPLAATAESFAFNGVPPGTYTFAVRAVNIAGSSLPSNAVTLTFPGSCPVPAAPLNATATVQGHAVTLTWLAGAGTPPAGYRIEVGSATGLSNLVVATTTATSVSAVAPAGTYFVRVRALNVCGASAPSNEVVITVQ